MSCCFLHLISIESEHGSVLNFTLQFSVLQQQSKPVSGLGGGFGLGGGRQQGGAHLSCSTVFKKSRSFVKLRLIKVPPFYKLCRTSFFCYFIVKLLVISGIL